MEMRLDRPERPSVSAAISASDRSAKNRSATISRTAPRAGRPPRTAARSVRRAMRAGSVAPAGPRAIAARLRDRHRLPRPPMAVSEDEVGSSGRSRRRPARRRRSALRTAIRRSQAPKGPSRATRRATGTRSRRPPGPHPRPRGDRRGPGGRLGRPTRFAFDEEPEGIPITRQDGIDRPSGLEVRGWSSVREGEVGLDRPASG